MSKRVIGITGTIGSGKNTLADLFIEKGWSPIDIDAIGKLVLQKPETIRFLVSQFGSGILDEAGKILPAKLGTLVFNDHKALQSLNGYMHPIMRDYAYRAIHDSPNSNFILHAALLFQMKLDLMCNLIIQIKVKDDILMKRLIARKPYLSTNSLESLIQKQKNDNQFFIFSDVIIDNSFGVDLLQSKFERLYSQLKEDTL